MNSRILYDRVSSNLALITNKLDIENANNNQSFNLILEILFLEVLNKIYECNLFKISK